MNEQKLNEAPVKVFDVPNEGDGLGVEGWDDIKKEDEDDFPLGQACDRFDPTCESCQ